MAPSPCPVLLIGQSLELARGVLLDALRAGNPEPVIRRARGQIAAGAAAVDVNGGSGADAVDLERCVRLLATAFPTVPIFIDTADPVLLNQVVAACVGVGVVAPLIANAIPVGAGGAAQPDATAALRTAARIGAGVVLSPRLIEPVVEGAVAGASAHDLALAALAAAKAARAGGVRGGIYLDALAFPSVSNGVRCRRSLEVLRAWRLAGSSEGDRSGLYGLVAVGNVGYGASVELASTLRAVYAAAAVGAGATALILPVEEISTLHAVRLACGVVPPSSPAEWWLVQVAAWQRDDGRALAPALPMLPGRYAEAARLIFGAPAGP